MKKIEKDIKKKSAQLIETSLPEIDSLDNIPEKVKKPRSFPLFLAPLGVAALIMVAVLIPVSINRPALSQDPVNVGNSNNPIHSNVPTSNHPIHSSNPDGHSRSNNPVVNHKHKFKNFDEFAYCSFFVNNKVSNSGALSDIGHSQTVKNKMPKQALADQNDGEPYQDEYGRYHYPISLDGPITFSDFIYFEFDTVNNAFLEERIGNGHIHALALSTNIFDEQMLILKNGDQYYSCLRNGCGIYGDSTGAYIEFSAHKFIEGFDVVKDLTNKRYLTMKFTANNFTEGLNSITIENDLFNIQPDTIIYDNTSVTSSIDDMWEQLGLDPDSMVMDGYGGPDALVYDIAQPEAFTLDEFEGTFTVLEDELYLGENKILDLNGASKIYAAEINKDSHRELVFETLEESKRMFVIYDIKNNAYLYHKAVSKIDGTYDYYLGMIENRLAIKAFEPGVIDDQYMVDYGYFAYYGESGVTIIWQNPFGLIYLRLVGVYEIDGETPVEVVDQHHQFVKNVPYVIEMELEKLNSEENPQYPNDDNPIKCQKKSGLNNMPISSPEWTMLSMNGGTYRYQITFSESGYSYYKIFFHHFGFELRAQVSDASNQQ